MRSAKLRLVSNKQGLNSFELAATIRVNLAPENSQATNTKDADNFPRHPLELKGSLIVGRIDVRVRKSREDGQVWISERIGVVVEPNFQVASFEHLQSLFAALVLILFSVPLCCAFATPHKIWSFEANYPSPLTLLHETVHKERLCATERSTYGKYLEQPLAPGPTSVPSP